jgi:hypothetical protein
MFKKFAVLITVYFKRLGMAEPNCFDARMVTGLSLKLDL